MSIALIVVGRNPLGCPALKAGSRRAREARASSCRLHQDEENDQTHQRISGGGETWRPHGRRRTESSSLSIFCIARVERAWFERLPGGPGPMLRPGRWWLLLPPCRCPMASISRGVSAVGPFRLAPWPQPTSIASCNEKRLSEGLQPAL